MNSNERLNCDHAYHKVHAECMQCFKCSYQPPQATPPNEPSLEQGDNLLKAKKSGWDDCMAYYNISPTKTMGGDEVEEIMEIAEILRNKNRPTMEEYETVMARRIVEAGFHRDVPSLMALDVEEVAKILYHQSQVVDKKDVFKSKWEDLTEIWKKPWLSMARAVCTKFSNPAVPDVGVLVEALEGLLSIHLPIGRSRYTFEEGLKIERAKVALTAFRTAQKGTNDQR